MSEDFVSRNEFNGLKQEVQELKEEFSEYNGLLHQIERKIDVIAEKLNTADEITILKLQPLEKRVTKLEENHSWLSKTVAATIIGIVIKLIFDISNYVN